ncbi:hypothetical protein HDU98_008828 [Podochytrium sp. JEL0797]|nr:hypothetical protein HDU98_008828 [Podochytrium sp. JEL0797]
MSRPSNGPLSHLKVVEFGGLAPVPFSGMFLADFGAQVIRIDRVGSAEINVDVLARGKRSVALDLRNPKGAELALRLIRGADIVLDPFRPGVLESLKLGPSEILAANPRCILARLTGFGQTGPYSKMAGHDINYIAVAGALAALGRAGENPIAPANILGDFAGGGLLCVVGILVALLEREKSGKGQVVDAAMIDGTAYLSTFLVKMNQAGLWSEPRGYNMLDTGAHFYETYKTKDGKFMAVGAIEPQFYKLLLTGLGLSIPEYAPRQLNTDEWPAMKTKFSHIFASKTREEWVQLFNGTDACVTPVLEWEEVVQSKHYLDRWGGHSETGVDGRIVFDKWDPPPAPILSRTPAQRTVGKAGPETGEHSADVLRECGLSESEIAVLVKERVILVNGIKCRL